MEKERTGIQEGGRKVRNEEGKEDRWEVKKGKERERKSGIKGRKNEERRKKGMEKGEDRGKKFEEKITLRRPEEHEEKN